MKKILLVLALLGSLLLVAATPAYAASTKTVCARGVHGEWCFTADWYLAANTTVELYGSLSFQNLSTGTFNDQATVFGPYPADTYIWSLATGNVTPYEEKIAYFGEYLVPSTSGPYCGNPKDGTPAGALCITT